MLYLIFYLLFHSLPFTSTDIPHTPSSIWAFSKWPLSYLTFTPSLATLSVLAFLWPYRLLSLLHILMFSLLSGDWWNEIPIPQWAYLSGPPRASSLKSNSPLSFSEHVSRQFPNSVHRTSLPLDLTRAHHTHDASNYHKCKYCSHWYFLSVLKTNHVKSNQIRVIKYLSSLYVISRCLNQFLDLRL